MYVGEIKACKVMLKFENATLFSIRNSFEKIRTLDEVNYAELTRKRVYFWTIHSPRYCSGY